MARKIRTSKIEEEITEFEKIEREVGKLKKKDLLSTGSALLNLSCSDRATGGLLKGKYYLFIGQSGAGKTWVTHSIFAESGLDERFKKYKLIYDDVEEGMNFDVAKYFGPKTAARISSPEPNRIVGKKKKHPQPNSKTIEQFYESVENHLDIAEEAGTGIIYVLDSMDALTSEQELAKAKADRAKRKAGKDPDGTYGDGKAKVNSQSIRRICARLEKSGSILIIVCQEKVDITSAFKAKTFAGGVALKFYSSLQIWFQIRGKIEVTVKGRKRDLGTLTWVKVEKNRLTGKRHKEILFPIYHNFGVDDTGAMVAYLIEEGHWEGSKTETAKIEAVEFKESMSKEKLVRHIEDNDLQPKLIKIVWKVWKEVQKAIEEKVVRRNKYE